MKSLLRTCCLVITFKHRNETNGDTVRTMTQTNVITKVINPVSRFNHPTNILEAQIVL